MRRSVWLLVLIALVLAAGAQAGEQMLTAAELDSLEMELSTGSDNVDFSPKLSLTKPLLPAITGLSIQQFENPVPMQMGTRLGLNREADVESEGESPSYWPVLGPILITVAVGTTTWLLFSLRSS